MLLKMTTRLIALSLSLSWIDSLARAEHKETTMTTMTTMKRKRCELNSRGGGAVSKR
jgi:hypothetical protein